MTEYTKLYELHRQLMLLNDILEDEAGQLFVELLQLLSDSSAKNALLSATYARFFRLLAEEAELYPAQMVGNAWQNHLLDRLLDSDNVLARKARQSQATPGTALETAARYDLARLQLLCGADLSGITTAVRVRLQDETLPGLEGFTDLGSTGLSAFEASRQEIKQVFLAAENWQILLSQLLEYYRSHDNSIFARYNAFRWRSEVNQPGGGHFEPVEYVDEQRFENLIGYDKERAVVIANTEQFLAGLSANHVLLYGARGTGKSSSVKALLPRYAEKGLRLIEVHKSELGDYPLIAEALRKRPEKFILFVDDLSFEAEEISYKDLKALLEGSLEARPSNLLIYATSNRRHLVKEQFSDNARPGDEEVNAWDTVEEKLSLSDRFGLIITFLAPNQQQYLAIVDGLARQAGIEMDAEDLHRRALRWELSHSGRSGRTARQFVDQLAGELHLSRISN
ncbi:MAG TPA: ATP-binding protein [Chloroflexia bacterium]|nr:ATP-binding protein [Chloroflexia bacterium]